MLTILVGRAWKGVRMSSKKKLPLPGPRPWWTSAALLALIAGALSFVGGVVLLAVGQEAAGYGFAGLGLAAMGVSRLPGPAKVLAVLVLGASSLTACGASPLKVAYSTLSTASAEYVKWDASKQAKITEAARKACDCTGTGSGVVCAAHASPACEIERAKAKPLLRVHLAFTYKADVAIASAYRALAIAALGGGTVATAQAAVGAALQTIADVRGGK